MTALPAISRFTLTPTPTTRLWYALFFPSFFTCSPHLTLPCQYDVAPGTNLTAVYPLVPGDYTVTWRYTHLYPSPSDVTNAQIFTITVTGVPSGGAIRCTPCQPGYAPIIGQTACAICPAGSYSPGGTATCLPVTTGFYTDQPGLAAPIPCLSGTFSSPDFTTCYTDCTYSVSSSLFYNISSLHDPNAMYFAGVDSGSNSYFLNLCTREQQNITCSDATGDALVTFACKQLFATTGDVDLGRNIGFAPLTSTDVGVLPGTDPSSQGLAVLFTGGSPCPQGGAATSTRIAMICDLSEGIGYPEFSYPATPENPVGSCQYYFTWRTSYACPYCQPSDYQVVVSDCVNGQQTISRIPSGNCFPATTYPQTTRSCKQCPANSTGQICSNRGTCQFSTGQCNCATRWTGQSCNLCLTGYYGTSCQNECPGGALFPCSGHGSCSSGTLGTGACTCLTGFVGTACNQCAEGFEGTTCTAIPATLSDVVPWWGFLLIGVGVSLILGTALFFMIKKRNAEKEVAFFSSFFFFFFSHGILTLFSRFSFRSTKSC